MKSYLFSPIIVLLLQTRISQAQDYKNIVLEGAGIRGIAYTGAIKYMEEKNMIKPMERVAGTSAGAIAALAISLGYTSDEMERLIFNTKLQKFNDGGFFFIGGIARLNRNFGWYKGNAFTHWLEEIIAAKTGDANITFQELHDRKFKDLYVTGTSLNNQKLIVFSYETYPTMRVKDAVRISMSIPLYFEAVIIDSAGNVVNKKNPTGKLDIMVDGGMIGNFPISVFDTYTFIGKDSVRLANMSTIGLRIDTPSQIQYDLMKHQLAPIPIGRFKNYISALYNYTIENLNRNSLSKEDWTRTVSISSGEIGPKIRKLSKDEKTQLMNNGYQAAKRYIEGNSRR
ncbi:MAG TPA: patatin [Cytophagales bacterium]|jgi:NTE family protein|nr:patatin [Cytophagales bacterium]